MSVILNKLYVAGNHSPIQNPSETIPAVDEDKMKTEAIASRNLIFPDFVQGAKKFASANKIRLLQAGAVLAAVATAIAIKKYMDSSFIQPINDIARNDADKLDVCALNETLPLEERLRAYFDSRNFTLPKPVVFNETPITTEVPEELNVTPIVNSITQECVLETDRKFSQLAKVSAIALSGKISADLNDHLAKVSVLNAETKANLANLAAKTSDNIVSCYQVAVSKGTDLKDAALSVTISVVKAVCAKIGKLLEPPKFPNLETHGNFAGLKDPIKGTTKSSINPKAKAKPFVFASDHRYHAPANKRRR